MTLMRFGTLWCSLATAIAAFVASIYWYFSSRPTPKTAIPAAASISDNPEIHVLGAQVNISGIQVALYEAARLNKKAAAWSAIAAFLGGVTAVLGFLSSTAS